MTLDELQAACQTFAVYPRNENSGVTYAVLGLAGEAGEVANKWKKKLRGDQGDHVANVIDELGDVLWYASAVATELGVPMSEVADKMLAKLKKRAEENTIKGSGDKR